MSKVRICCVQYDMRSLEGFEDFARQCQYFVEVAANYRADFVLFPEMLTNQLLSATPGLSAKAAITKLDSFTERYVGLFSALATKHRINVIGGSHFTVENSNTYNIAYLFERSGSVGRQYKIHVTPSERDSWGIAPGNSVEVFQTDCGKVAIQICYDIEFPETSRLATERGAQIIFVPFCTDDRQGYLRVRYCAQARCVENQIYVATAGVVGPLTGVRDMDVHYAQSGIFTPSDFGFARDGIAGEAPVNLEAVVVQDLDLAALEHARLAGTVRNWADRRTDLFEIKEKRP